MCFGICTDFAHPLHKSIKNLSLNRKRMGVEVGTRRQNSILQCSTIPLLELGGTAMPLFRAFVATVRKLFPRATLAGELIGC
jgi:hypothetical protein